MPNDAITPFILAVRQTDLALEICGFVRYQVGILPAIQRLLLARLRIYSDCSSAIRLDEHFELLAPLISQVVITTVTSGAVVQCQSVC
jgi:hypothetical protein